jgi:hypothetical protein
LLTSLASQAPVADEDLAALPDPEHITLLLKNHKETVLLSVRPDTPFSEIKSLLLAVLQARDVTSIDGTPVSDNSDDIEFGVLRNKKNPAEGWVALGDAKGGKRKGKKSASNDSPAGAGFADGSMLAFRFRTKSEVEEQNREDEDDQMQIRDDTGWNVVLPSYDDEQ